MHLHDRGMPWVERPHEFMVQLRPLEIGIGNDPIAQLDRAFVTLPCRERQMSAAQELLGRCDCRSPRVDQQAEDLALSVDGPPEADHSAVDFQIDLVEMPSRMRLQATLS
jgi:hypothetical protein